MAFKDVPLYLRFILLTIAACFAIGTTTHLIDIWQYGFLGYSKWPHVSLALNIFWTSLVFIDPLVMVLLFTRRNSGLVAGSVVLLADVVINTIYSFICCNEPFKNCPSLSLQVAALLFLVFSLPLWRVNSKNRLMGFYKRMFAFLPLLSFVYWLFVHVLATVDFIILPATRTPWNIWCQASLLLLDGFIIILICRKMRIAYYVALPAVIILATQIVVCTTLVMFGLSSTPVPLSAGISVALCFLSIVAMLMTKKSNSYKCQAHIPFILSF